MKSIFSKTNAPYLVSGALATITLLASGVFVVAPYIGFLAPVAALSLGLPLIVVAAVFSVATIAFSCAAISKNNTIAEKNEVINQKEREISDKNKTIAEKQNQLNQQNNEIASLREQLSKKEDEVKIYKQKISEKNDQITQTEEEMGALGKVLTSTKEASISGRVTRIVKNGLKGAYSAMPSAESVRNWIPSSKTVGYIAGGAGLIYTATNGLVATDTSPNEVNPIAKDLGNHTLSSNSRHIPVSLQVTMENKTNEYSKKLDDALESAKNNFGIPQDHSEPQWVKDLHKSEITEEIVDNGTLPNLFSEDSNSDYQCAKPSVNHAESSKTVDTAIATVYSNAHTSSICSMKDNTSGLFSGVLNKLLSINPFGSRENNTSIVNGSDNQFAKPDSVRAISETDTAVAIYSNPNISNTCSANYETSLAKYDSTGTCSSQDVCLNKNGNIWSYISKFIPFGSHRSSKTDVATYSNTDASGTCPANYETSYDSTDTCLSDNQFAKPDITQVESGKAISESDSSNVVPFCTKVSNNINTSKLQGTLIDSVELERLTREVHPSAYPKGLPRVF